MASSSPSHATPCWGTAGRWGPALHRRVGVGSGPGIVMGPEASPTPVSQIIDPFVEVEIIGLPVDCSREQTRVVDDNGEARLWLCHAGDGSLRGGLGLPGVPGALPRPPSVTVLGAAPL